MNISRPHYRHSLRMLFPFLSALLGRPASLSRTCALLIQDAPIPPRVLNTQNIPATGDLILALNHYDRPGMGMWWSGALAVATIAHYRTDPREFHPVMVREWWYPPGGFGRMVKQPLTRWAFRQFAKAYKIALLPPALDEYKGTGGIDVRRVLALTRGDKPELVAMAPEGYAGKNGTLKHPPDGAGLFLLLLSHDTIPFLPVGIFEDDENHLTANFGAPFMLCVPRTLARAERDREAARQAMVQIGMLLPEKLWGAYREDIKNSIAKTPRHQDVLVANQDN